MARSEWRRCSKLLIGGAHSFSYNPGPWIRSLSAVSEAPTSKELGVEALWGALQIQRLEGSRPWGLWDLYLDEAVLMVCEFAVAIMALGFH